MGFDMELFLLQLVKLGYLKQIEDVEFIMSLDHEDRLSCPSMFSAFLASIDDIKMFPLDDFTFEQEELTEENLYTRITTVLHIPTGLTKEMGIYGIGNGELEKFKQEIKTKTYDLWEALKISNED